MLCSNCGNQNGFIAKFCQSCGKDLRFTPTAPGTSAPTAPRRSYAGFWLRFAAYILDNALVYIGTGLSLFVLGLMFAPPAVGWRGLWTHGMILAPLVPWLYWAVMESSPYQATFGKMLLGLKVTDERGRKISFARATIRYWSKMLSALLIMAGFLMIGFTPRKEGLHDIIAGTLVVKR